MKRKINRLKKNVRCLFAFKLPWKLLKQRFKKIFRVSILFQCPLCILRMIPYSLRNTMGSVYFKDNYCITASKFCIPACANDFFFLGRIFWEPRELLYIIIMKQKHFLWCQVSTKSVFRKKKNHPTTVRRILIESFTVGLAGDALK